MKVIDTIKNITFDRSEFRRDNNVWRAETLYLFAKAKEYPVMDLPLWAVDLSDEPFESRNLKQFIENVKRVNDCSLEYPVILDDNGQIADGYHRLCKAILNGDETIKAIRLEEMPSLDRIEEENEE